MEFKTNQVVIANDYFPSQNPGYLNLYCGEVLLLLERLSDTRWKAKNTYNFFGSIDIHQVTKIDISAAKADPIIVTLDWFQYFLSGTFFIYQRDEKIHFVYNNYGTVLQAQLDVSVCDGPQEIYDSFQAFVWRNRNILRMYVDDETVLHCNRYLNNDRIVHSESGFVARYQLETPRPYIPDWYHGYTNKAYATKLLKVKPSGTFFVCKGRNRFLYILSINAGDIIHHVPIVVKRGKIYFENAVKQYDSVVDLIEYNFSLPLVLVDSNDLIPLYMEKWISNRHRTIPEGFEALDPYWTELYIKSLEEGTERQCLIRLMVVGHAGVGKTTLSRNLMGKPTDNVESTNGIDVHVRTCEVQADGSWIESEPRSGDNQVLERIARVLKTTSENENNKGQIKTGKNSDLSFEESKPINVPFVREKDTVLSADSLTDGNGSNQDIIQSPTYSELGSGLIGEDQISLSNENMRTVIMLNKTPLNKEPQCTLSVWDFGGQFVFYATHQLFHSPRAIYLLVLDISKDLKDNVDVDIPNGSRVAIQRDAQSFIMFWMHSIHTFAGSNSGEPPVVLVGTHRDKLDGLDENKNQHAEEMFEDIRKLFDGSPLLNHIQPEHFCLDNLKPENAIIEEVRETIVNVAMRQSFWNQQLPAKWIPLEKSISQLEGVDHLTFEQVCDMDAKNEISIKSKDEIRLFLMHHHFQGILVYFNEDQLSDHIVLNPQWLIDAFKCIVTSRRFCKVRANLRSLWYELESKAILRRELIDEVWKQDDQHNFLTDREMILKFMVRLGIIAKSREFQETSEHTEELDYYLVPSLLPLDERQENLRRLSVSCRCTIVSIVFMLKDAYISPTIYHRTTAGAISKWAVLEHCGRRLLSGSYGVYRLDAQHAGSIRLTTNTLELDVHNLCCDPVKRECADFFRRFITKVLKHELNKTHSSDGTHYTLMYKCTCATNLPGELLTEDKLREGRILPCLNSETVHKIDTLEAYREWYLDSATLADGQNNALHHLIDDGQIGAMARAIGLNWKLLGISLGVPQAELDKFQMDYPYSSALQIRHMLLAWRRKAGIHATIESLINEMETNRAVTIDWDVVKNAIDNSDTSVKTVN